MASEVARGLRKVNTGQMAVPGGLQAALTRMNETAVPSGLQAAITAVSASPTTSRVGHFGSSPTLKAHSMTALNMKALANLTSAVATPAAVTEVLRAPSMATLSVDPFSSLTRELARQATVAGGIRSSSFANANANAMAGVVRSSPFDGLAGALAAHGSVAGVVRAPAVSKLASLLAAQGSMAGVVRAPAVSNLARVLAAQGSVAGMFRSSPFAGVAGALAAQGSMAGVLRAPAWSPVDLAQTGLFEPTGSSAAVIVPQPGRLLAAPRSERSAEIWALVDAVADMATELRADRASRRKMALVAWASLAIAVWCAAFPGYGLLWGWHELEALWRLLHQTGPMPPHYSGV